MLWLGLQVAQGNSIWGLSTLQCDVLYLSLEDTQHRIKDRLYNLTDSAPDNLYFAVISGLIGGGLEEQITDFLTEHPATKLLQFNDLVWELVERKSSEDIHKAELPKFLFRVVDFMERRTEWVGTATVLLIEMGEQEVTLNMVTKYLGQFAYEVLEPMGIEYRTKRTGKSRLIKFLRRYGDDANDAGIAI